MAERFRFNNGNTPSISESLSNRGDVMPQSWIVSNCAVSPLLSIRSRNSSLNQNEKYGSLGVGTDGLATCLDIRKNELVFTYNKMITHKGGRNPLNEQKLRVFTSFNAISLDGAKSQWEFEDKFRFVGFSHGNVRANDSTQPSNGLAVLCISLECPWGEFRDLPPVWQVQR